jgi:hypothetical protein
MPNTFYNCLYLTASSAKGLEICSPRVGFFKYFQSGINEEICFMDVSALLSTVLRSPINPISIPELGVQGLKLETPTTGAVAPISIRRTRGIDQTIQVSDLIDK